MAGGFSAQTSRVRMFATQPTVPVLHEAFSLIRLHCQEINEIKEKNAPFILLFQLWECSLKQRHILQLHKQL